MAQRDDWLAAAVEQTGNTRDEQERRALVAIQATARAGGERAAQANDLARRYLLPGDTVQRNLPEIQAQRDLDAQSDIVRANPRLHDWLGNERNAAAAQGDLRSLDTVSTLVGEHSIGNEALGLNTDAARLRRSIRESFDPLRPVSFEERMQRLRSDPRSRRAVEVAEQRQARASKVIDADGIGQRAAVKFWQRIKGLGAGGGRQVDAMLVDMGLDPDSDVSQWLKAKAAAAEDFSNRPVTGETTWEALKAKPSIGKLARFVIEQGASSVADMGVLANPAGIIPYIEMQSGSIGQQRAVNDGRTDATAADTLAALPSSVASAALERLGLHGIFGTTGRTVLGRITKAFGAEAVTEALQSPIEYAGGTVGTEAGFDPWVAADQAFAGAVAGGFIGGTIRGGVESAARAHLIYGRAQASRNANTMDGLIRAAQGSTLHTNDPQGFAEFVQQQVDASVSAIDRVFVPAEKVRSFFQESGGDYRTDAFWGKYADQVDEAAALGSDVVIPLGEAVAGFAQNGHWDTFRDSVRLSPGGMSLAEARSIEKSHADQLGRQADEAVADEAFDTAPAQRVYDEVLVQARRTGVSLNSARAYADLWSAYYSRRAERRGTDAWTLFNQSVGGIVSEMPDAVRPYERADQLDRLVNVMRRDKAAPSDPALRGPSLASWIAARGGIEDRGGDLASMGGDRWHREAPFRRKLIKATGDAAQGDLEGTRGSTPNSPDVLLADAIEAGFFPELQGDFDAASAPDVSALYAALERELGGDPVYSADLAKDGGIETDKQLRDAATSLRGFLENRSIDPDTATTDDIRKALSEAQGSPAQRTLEQWAAWNVPPAGMDPAMVLHHNGPENLPRGRPGGIDRPYYFGTGDFSDSEGAVNFGPWRYTFWVPQSVSDNIVTIDADSPAGLALARAAAAEAFPDDDTGFDEQLAEGDEEALSDFYSDVWTDPYRMLKALRDAGLQGARLRDEFLLLPDAIDQLVGRRNGPDDGTVSFYQSQPEHPPFYSALLRTVEGAKTAKAPADQWKATLLNAPGVKAEEVEWSGLLEWLDEQPGAVSRTDIEQFVRAGGISVSEVVLGDPQPRAVAAEADRLYEEWVKRHALALVEDSDEMFPGLPEEVEETEDGGWEFEGWVYDTEAEALDVAADRLAQAEAEWDADNYARAEAIIRTQFDEESFIDEAKKTLGVVPAFAEWTSTREATETYRELLITLPLGEGTNPRKAPETHWDQPGVVAHVRFQGKRDAEGRPVLFVEEVQSDWHQKGRDEGYEVPPAPERVAEARASVAEGKAALEASQRAIVAWAADLDLNPADEAPAPERGFGGFVFSDQPLDEQASYSERAMRRLMRSVQQPFDPYDSTEPAWFAPAEEMQAGALLSDLRSKRLAFNERNQAYARMMEPTGVPQAPFKTTWPALAMKRVIRWAADNGYHSVAWTTGDQQAARYDLSAPVEDIRIHPTQRDDGGAILNLVADVADMLIRDDRALSLNDWAGGRQSVRMDAAQLKEVFGADLGGRLLAAEPGEVFEGKDLQIGGEGMRGFYDRNLINITNGLIKKHGAKVAPIDVLDPTPRADQMMADAERARRDADALAPVDERRATTLYADANAAELSAQRMRDAALNQQWGFEVTPSLAAAAQGGFSLFQGGEVKARGRIDFERDGRATIRLFEGRDLSTLLHEGGHLWLEELRADALAADAPQELRDDWETVKRWFADNGAAVIEGADIPVDAHELWARGMERYFMEGKAPTSALQRAFSSFRSWLLRIYKVVANLNAPITDDLRRVMDRMLASDAALAEAADAPESALIFKTAEEAGMTEAEFAAYVASAETVRTKAFDALLYRTMEAIRRERTVEWKRQRDTVRREVETEVNARPEFRALALLRGRGGERVQLNREAFVLEFGSDALSIMPRGVPPTIVDKGGVHPDILAQMAGFPTGHEMIDALIGVEHRQRQLRLEQDKRSVKTETIDVATDQAMRERFGDPLTDGSIEEEALAAIHSDNRAEVIASEVRQLSRRANPRRGSGDQLATPLTLAREWAERKVREGKAGEEASASALLRHQRNEAKAARAAQAAMLAGNVDEAFVQKQRQLYHHELWRAAKSAKDQIDKIVRRLGKYAKARVLPTMDPDYLERIHDLLEAYDFRPRSNRERAERVSFGAWVAAKEAEGEEVHVPPRLRDFQRVNFKDATVEDLVGLDDAVESIAHLGRRKKTLLLAKEEMQLEDAVAEAVAVGEGLRSLPHSNERNPDAGLRVKARRLDAVLIKIEFLADLLDGNNPNGVFNRLLVRGAQEAATEKSRLVQSVVKPLADLYNGMSRAQQRRMREKVSVPEMVTRNPETGAVAPTVFERSELIAIALNTGNESNLSKLVRGESRIVPEENAWTADMVMAVLDRELNEADWDFVQKVWRQVDSLWPAIVRSEREITGVKPEKVEPRIVQTRFGAINGGYYPVVFDPLRSAMAESNYEDDAAKMLGQMGRVISTPKGHTITRTEAAAPIMLSLEAVLLNHINRVTTRIAYGRYVRDTLKFIKHPKIKDLIDRKAGREYRGQLKPWLERQVNDAALDTAQIAAIDRLLRGFRVNATMVGLGFRMTTMFAQAAGLANSVAEIGPKYAALGAADTVRKLGSLREFVFSRSPVMAERSTEFDRDVRTFFRDLSADAGPLDRFRAMAFWGIGNVQLFTVDMPTWLGGYRKALDQGMSEDDAVAFADKAVRKAQSSGRVADLSAIQSGPEGLRVLTMFYSFWNVFYNKQRETVHAARNGDWRRAGMNVFWVMMVGPLLSAFLVGDWPDEESEEDVFHWAMRKMFFGLWLGLPIIREVTSGLERKSIGKPAFTATTPVVRAFDEIQKPAADAWSVARGDEPSDRWLQNAITAPGYFVGLPTGQVGASAQYLLDVAEGDQNPDNAGQVVWGVVKGPQASQE